MASSGFRNPTIGVCKDLSTTDCSEYRCPDADILIPNEEPRVTYALGIRASLQQAE